MRLIIKHVAVVYNLPALVIYPNYPVGTLLIADICFVMLRQLLFSVKDVAHVKIYTLLFQGTFMSQ